jgi:hypothetical protein
MANDKQRGELIAKAVEEINRQVRSAEVSALKLDEYAAAAAEPAEEEPPPVTLRELERTISESQSLGERLKPHPKLAGAHLLDWHGEWREVTFDPRLFDEHPNTLTLLSYGDGLLAELLDVVEPPTDGRATGFLARCTAAGVWKANGYYGLSDQAAVPTLSKLNTTMNGQSAELSESHQTVLQNRFSESLRKRQAQEAKATEDRKKSRVSSLTEEIRQLLVEAAYIELAMASNRDLFDEEMPLDFSEQAYERLKRHRVPFAGAMKMAGQSLPVPRASDPLYLRLRDSKRDVLTRRFETARVKLGDRLRELVAAKNAAAAESSESTVGSITLQCFSLTSST